MLARPLDQDRLKTELLGHVFDDTAASYKFFWFLAILDLLPNADGSMLRFDELFVEMAALAWTPVVRFRLSFGLHDKLQDAIAKVQQAHPKLDAGAPPGEIRKVMALHARDFAFLREMVPTRFLSPFLWKPKGLRTSALTRFIVDAARDSQNEVQRTPYSFDAAGDRIVFGADWRSFLYHNRLALRDFAERNLIRFLESRNPSAPSISQKLRLPTERDLARAKAFWTMADARAREVHRPLRNIYTADRLPDSFAIDHFIPWSFVVHDQLWNLVPTDRSSNSAKSDRLPRVEALLPEFAALHHFGIHAAGAKPQLLEDYLLCFRVQLPELLAMPEEALTMRLHDALQPLATRRR